LTLLYPDRIILVEMGCFRLDAIAELARQMRFTPLARRMGQLDAAEEFLLNIRPDQSYTIAEILCAVTGFEPKHADQTRFTGEALQHDLGVLLEDISETLQLHINASAEPILTIDDIAQRLNVTSKTVQRWRRRGLPARRFTFADGKRRIGLRATSVHRFIGVPHTPELIEPAPLRRQRDLQWLLTTARDLAARGYWPMLAAQRLARATGQSPLALLQLIREQAPDLAFASEPTTAVKKCALELRSSGHAFRTIAANLGLPTAGVYRIILDRRLARAIHKRIRFIDDPLYHQDQPLAAIDAIISQDTAAPATGERLPHDLPPYLADVYRIPMLEVAQERGLFLKYHYLRFLAHQCQGRLDPQTSDARHLRQLRKCVLQTRAIRSRIVEANLRLVVSVARKHVRSTVSLMELVSEGNLILMRAVDAFDIHRGHRFSTYAVYALMRGYARFVPEAHRLASAAHDPDAMAHLHDLHAGQVIDQCEHRDQVGRLMAGLESRERDVVAGRFGLNKSRIPMTCHQLGQRLQLSRQRIIQIEQRALAKLRDMAK
jgi:RNA polymerase sigma factor (sigma-70 family)